MIRFYLNLKRKILRFIIGRAMEILREAKSFPSNLSLLNFPFNTTTTASRREKMKTNRADDTKRRDDSKTTAKDEWCIVFLVRSHSLWRLHRLSGARVQGDRVLQARRTRTSRTASSSKPSQSGCAFVFVLHGIQGVTRTYFYTCCDTRSETMSTTVSCFFYF